MKSLRYKLENAPRVEVVINPGNPITTCELFVDGMVCSWGMSVAHEGDTFNLETGMKKAFDSAVKRKNPVLGDYYVDKAYWGNFYHSLTPQLNKWLEEYEKNLLIELSHSMNKVVHDTIDFILEF